MIRYIKQILVLSVSALVFTLGYGQDDKVAMAAIKKHRKEQYKEFKKRETSPLEDGDIKKFTGLNYFPIDLTYRVPVKFVKNNDPVFFEMKTSTSRLPQYTKYGEIFFELHGEEYKLEVYQSKDLRTRPGFEDYLFIPFTDPTNGEETYEGGRYLDFYIPKPGDEVLYIDFNSTLSQQFY